MKKLFLSLCFAAVLTLTACKDEEKAPALSCEDAGTALLTALEAWAGTPTVVTCQAAKDAYQDALNACSDLFTPAQLQELQDGLDGLPDCVE